MERRILDTQWTGKRALTAAQTIIEDSGHLLQPIDADVDIGIDGYIRLRKKVKLHKVIKNKKVACEDYVDTGNLVGIQVKGVTSIPKSGSNSYYITLADKDCFGVNFNSKENLDSHKIVWRNFIGPVILIFVDLKTKKCWWTNLNDPKSFSDNGYSVIVKKKSALTQKSFFDIKKLGKEVFAKNELAEINTNNSEFFTLGLYDFKKSAREAYKNLSGSGEFYFETVNPTLGKINYTKSGWRHITRLNRRKMRIINSLLLLGVSRRVCETVTSFTKVKKGLFRESKRYIKKVDFLTLRAKVNFNFRESSIVQVVVRRVKTFDKIHSEEKIPDELFFHSVYEPFRKE